MIAYAPKYYKLFKCIAGRCTHSCCTGWKVSIDSNTREKYLRARGAYADALINSISKDEDGYYISTLDNGRCPHLDDCGLCKVISECGEEYLSEICREHPRYYNIIGKRVEIGIGASCPEAARLIISEDNSLSLVETDIPDTEHSEDDIGYSPLALRSRLANIIAKCDDHKAAESEIMLLLGLPDAILSADFMMNVFGAQEYLYPENKEVIFDAIARGSNRTHHELLKVLAYFIYRHVTAATTDQEAAAMVGFSLLSARMVGKIADITGNITDALRLYSEEIEYSSENTDAIIFDIQSEMI